MDRFTPEATDAEIKKEKARARDLRTTPWWRKKCASGVCHYCGGRFSPDALTMDHLVPLVRGGKSIKPNLVPSCKDCNNKKKNMLPYEWEEYVRKSTPDRDEDLL